MSAAQHHPRRPEFIAPGQLRAWLSGAGLDKTLSVGGIRCTSYLQRCERSGKPLPSRTHRGIRSWRALDIIARARAEGLSIDPAERERAETTIRELKEQISDLTASVEGAQHAAQMMRLSCELTGAYLLREEQIVAAAAHVPDTTGVYFLIHQDRVIYVGQSVAILARIEAHRIDKTFDRVAYIPCAKELLNALESLYIHTLRPRLNQSVAKGMMRTHAPMSLPNLLAWLSAE